MPDMPPTEDLDFLLEHGEEYAILGSGERVRPGSGGLPRDAGTHLVAGTARKGVYDFKELPEGWPLLDPTRRWLGFRAPDSATLELFDISKGMSPAFRFEWSTPGTRAAIHPQGDLIAAREGDDIRLYGPDGHLIRSAPFPRPTGRWADESLEFSACGGYLWLVTTRQDGEAVLHLLRCPSLEVADSREPDWDPDNIYDKAGEWFEVTTEVNPVTGHLAIRRQAGDDWLTVHFYAARKGKIRLHGPHLNGTKDHGVIHGERVWSPVFAPDGKRFLLLDSDGSLHEFSFPDCRHIAVVHDSDLREDREDYEANFDSHGYAGGLVLVKLGKEVLALRSGDLRPSPWRVDGNVLDNSDILPNGLLCTRYGEQTDISDFRVSGRSFPVVAAIDSKTARADAVYRKIRSRWQEADDGAANAIGWLETNFSVANE